VKIHNNVNDAIQLDRSGAKVNGKGAANKAADVSATSTDKISISDLSQQLSVLESKLSQGEEFDAARVEAIKQAMRDGEFKVNAEVVADKLIASVKEMLGH